jgi:alpha-tubulin suppressor-like RCC1 family protein
MNARGQLGDGTTISRSTMPERDLIVGVKAVSLGAFHTCVLMQDGGVRCWGDNSKGQLGSGTYVNALAPATLDVLTNAMAISAGARTTCALLKGGGVRCWGDNDQGQLGIPGATMNKPPAVDVFGGAKAVVAGANHTCAVTEAGGLRCWGNGAYGELGYGNYNSTVAPPETDVLTGVKAVALGQLHTCALLQAGGVRCWGVVETLTNKPPSTDVITDGAAVAAGYFFNCALTNQGGVRCWGRENDSGQLGNGTNLPGTTPARTDVLTDAQAIAAGGNTVCALMRSGGLRCWGDGGQGQLGNAVVLPVDRAVPPESDVLTGARAVSAVADHSCALMDTGGVRCWGANREGEFGDGTKTSRIRPRSRRSASLPAGPTIRAPSLHRVACVVGATTSMVNSVTAASMIASHPPRARCSPMRSTWPWARCTAVP